MTGREGSQSGHTYVLSGDNRGAIINIESSLSGEQRIIAEARPRIFLSYSWNDDKPFVEQLQRDLEARGFDVWRDETDLPSRGPDLPDELTRAIDDCDRFVPVIGPAAFASKMVQQEWAYARKKCKAVTAVWRLGEQRLPAEFNAKLSVDFREERHDYDYDRKVEELARLLGEQIAIPGPFLTALPNLPPGVIPRRELIELRKLLMPLMVDQTTLAITGISATRTVQAGGGLGKSILAAIFARECQTLWAFPDGIVWLPVGQSPDPAQLAAGLGALFRDDPKEYTAENSRDRLQRLLANRKALIILDDVWNAEPANTLIVDAPGCRWLITTRLGGVADDLGLTKERIVKLGYLTVEEGLDLIAQQLEDMEHRDRLTHGKIVHKLGGHIQAIAIAAALLKKGKPADELLRRLQAPDEDDNPLSILQLPGGGREKNLEKSFGLSYTYMDETSQRCFRALGVFSEEGTFDAAAAAAIWGEREAVAVEMLHGYVESSLVGGVGDRRYAMHNLLRDYALALLKKEEEYEETMLRYFSYYNALYDKQSIEPNSEVSINSIDDLENIQQAIKWQQTNSLVSSVPLTTNFLHVSINNLKIQQNSSRLETTKITHNRTNSILQSRELEGSTREEAFRKLSKFLHERKEIMEIESSPIILARIYKSFADLAIQLDSLEDVEDHYIEAIQQYELTENQEELAQTYGNLGDFLFNNGELDRALQCYRAILKLSVSHA